jgi:hypothetical protein
MYQMSLLTLCQTSLGYVNFVENKCGSHILKSLITAVHATLNYHNVFFSNVVNGVQHCGLA